MTAAKRKPDGEPAPPAERKPGNSQVYTENKRLKKELAELRAALDAPPINLDAWYVIPQQMRDEFAARALFAENGNWATALRRLGFETKGGKQLDLFGKIFGTPGCQALLREELNLDADSRKEVALRMLTIAKRGSDDAAVRATQMLSRLEGWLQDEDRGPGTVIHLWGMVEGARAQADPKRVTTLQQSSSHPALPSTDPRVLLGHEPGEAVRIDVSDAAGVVEARAEAGDVEDDR